MEIRCRVLAKPREQQIAIGSKRYIQSVITLSTDIFMKHVLTIRNSNFHKEFVINNNILHTFEKNLCNGLGTIIFINPAFDILLHSTKVTEIQALFKRICAFNLDEPILQSIPPLTKKKLLLKHKTTNVKYVKSTTLSSKPEPFKLIVTDFLHCIKKSKLSKNLKSIMVSK